MNNFNDEKQFLLELIRNLKPSDLSVLQAALETPGSQIATVRNSPNDVLWSKLEELGIAKQTALDIEIPPQLRNFQPKSFTLTDRGRIAITELLKP